MFRNKKLEEENKQLHELLQAHMKGRDYLLTELGKLQQEVSTLKASMKMINLMANQTIKNEHGEETSIIKFNNVEEYAKSIIAMTCFYVVNDVSTETEREVK